MSKHISWHVELRLKSGQLDTFRVLTDEMVEATKSEAGTLIYERFINDDSHYVDVFERYVDCTAAVAHLLRFEKMYGDRFARTVERRRFTVLGTPTRELKEILDPLGARYVAPLAGFSRN
jgi:quinol monooxygenase YgiN